MIEPGPTGSAGAMSMPRASVARAVPATRAAPRSASNAGWHRASGGRLGDVHRLLVHEDANGHFFFCTKAGVVGARTGWAMRLR